MANPFFDQPILNAPYEMPSRHWELDANGQPTQAISQGRRIADFITPIPKPRKSTKDKKTTMETYWVPGVNNVGNYGRWGFAEFTDVSSLTDDLESHIRDELDRNINLLVSASTR